MKKQEAQKKNVQRAPRQAAVAAANKRERTKPRQFVREVVAELKKVAWPTRQEVVAYSIVVLVSVVVIGAVIFAMDYVFTRAVLALYGVQT
ncbi:MAG: preprotein translocase subunit SecE [Actinomycetota bacterium]|jgi:preprotein translocase subunit SecE|nr:preprotein translocase subunit SecE [Actinomycetota bacterium]